MTTRQTCTSLRSTTNRETVQNFDKLRTTSEKELRAKLYAIQGDITMPKFGIKPEDMSLLSRECSIVFNSAATIRFVEPIDVAVRNNIYSVGQLVDFCDCLENLEALVHLSTAYSNCHKKDTIYEIFYEPPMSGDQVQGAIQQVRGVQDKIHVYPSNKSSTKDAMSRSACELQTFYHDNLSFEQSVSAKANGSSPEGHQSSPSRPPAGYDLLEEFSRIALRQSNRPNTYTFTKAISENYLLDKVRARADRYLNDKIPVAIVRPSIVGGCWREPIVGHVDNYNGPTGAMMSLYTGALQAMPGKGSRVADIVPVDMVTNMVLCVGWFLASGEANKSSMKSIKSDKGAFIFNMVSGFRNPLRWHQVTDKIAELAYIYPSKYLVRLPSSYFLEAGKKYELYDKINQKLPALVADFIKSKILRQELNNRTSSMAAYRRVKQVGDTLTPFTSNQWHLSDANTKALFDHLNEPDRRLFHFDVKAIDWPEYLRNYIIGSRVYTLRDDPKNIPGALKQLKR